MSNILLSQSIMQLLKIPKNKSCTLIILEISLLNKNYKKV